MKNQQRMIRIIYLLVLFTVVTGEKLAPFVVGGEPAELGDYPYMVSIQLLRTHICGGALVTLKHVVTSASCIATTYRDYKKVSSLTVLVGTVNQSRGGTRYQISTISTHPNYAWYDSKYDTIDYDIGVIELSKEVTLTQYVQPIPLGFQFVEDVPMTITGWGKTQEGGPESEYILYFGHVLYLKKNQCQKFFDFPIKKRHICNVPVSNIGGCATDLGGPLVSEGKLVGILTTVRNCGNGKPDIYISVFYHAHFLLDMLKEEDE